MVKSTGGPGGGRALSLLTELPRDAQLVYVEASSGAGSVRTESVPRDFFDLVLFAEGVVAGLGPFAIELWSESSTGFRVRVFALVTTQETVHPFPPYLFPLPPGYGLGMTSSGNVTVRYYAYRLPIRSTAVLPPA